MKNKIKILQINAVLGVGSTGTIVSDLHNLIKENGYESIVAFSLSNQQYVGSEYYIFKNFIGKKIHALFSRISGKQAYFSTLSTIFFLNYLNKVKPQIVHLHNLHSNFINLNILLIYLRLNNISTVITLHDCWFYTGGCFHYTDVACDKWLKKCGNCPKRYSDTPAYLFDKSHRILLDRTKYLTNIKNLHVVGVSNWISSQAEMSLLKNKNITTIKNGIDLELFKPIESNLKISLNLEDKFIIIGNYDKWTAQSNKLFFDNFIKKLDSNTTLLLFGSKKNSSHEFIPNVKLIGYTTDKTLMREIYSIADVFVNCSKEDSLSLVNLECQACGTPVITFRNTGVKETVNEICSYSVNNDDINEIFNIIYKIKLNGRDFYKIKCREWIKSGFEKEECYSQYIDLYKRILIK